MELSSFFEEIMEQIIYHSQKDTIAAISTPQAAGGIGIVRISGTCARETAGRVFVSLHGKKLDDIKGYTALYGRVHDKDGDIDEAIALNFKAPASFTGEDVVELSCHGGLSVMRRLLKAVFEAGAVPAAPGEFTRRAFLNGKIGLTEAESVMQIVSAQGEQAAKAALASHDGALEKKIKNIREKLVSAAAHLSAWADYPEEDIPEITPESLKITLSDVKLRLSELLNQFEAGRALREGVETVIAGRPNVGKSTLMNLLSGCERSIVTQYAGTTRDVVENTVLLGGIPILLADTAGIRTGGDPAEKIGVLRAFEKIHMSTLVFAVFDSSQPLDNDDLRLIDEIKNTKCIAVLNKSDLPQKIDKEYINSKFSHRVYMSAISGSGMPDLEKTVAEILGTAEIDPADGMLFTERQRDASRRAAEYVDEAIGALEGGMTLDAVTISVDEAVDSLLELTGEKASAAVIDSVFSHFCVGK